MGCGQSKIENEETVNRCKERKQYMERAVTARNKFAAAHVANAMSLKNTGAALSDFAQGEAVHPSPSAAVAVGTSSTAVGGGAAPPRPVPYENFPPPPPPLPASFTSSSPLQRAATMPEFSIPRPEIKRTDSIIEEEDEDDADGEGSYNLKRRSSKGRLRGEVKTPEVEHDGVLHQTPQTDVRDHVLQKQPPPPPETKGMSWDYFFPMESVPAPSLPEIEDHNVDREETRGKMVEGRARTTEIDANNAIVETVTEVVGAFSELPPRPPPPEAAMAPSKSIKRVKQGALVEAKKKGTVSNISLVQIFVDLDDCFLKASESAHEVSRMLEATRLHYHSNFADKRGHINHSERVMRVITWNRSIKGLNNVDNHLDDFDSEEHETHASVLDKMLAWEKKLYEEVKAGELMKLEYQRKVNSLNKLKNHGSNTETLERMKAAVSHLHTRYIVDMQSMDSTVSEINRLRDVQLYPKLVTLVDGMATMWETMRIYHENQSKIVESFRLLDASHSPKETSDHHHERTRQLGGVVQEWYTNLSEVMSQQKEYIKALSNWLKLNLVPIDTNLKETVSSPSRPENPPIQLLLHAWHDYLHKLPDEPAKSAINNFAAIIKTIWQYQKEELEYRNKCAESRKELKKKTRDFENWYNKYMQKRTPPDEMDPERAHDKDLVADRQLVVEVAKKRLEEDEEAYQRQCIQVRDKSLMSLKTHLPELFRALSDFTFACSDMYSHLKNIGKMKKGNEV